jgi:hypothetical protein
MQIGGIAAEMTIGTSLVAAASLFASALLFGPPFIVQFRGDAWLPGWYPAELRLRPRDPILRTVAIIWTGFWLIGGQATVLFLLIRHVTIGLAGPSVIFGIELAAASLFSASIVRFSRPTD